MLVALVPTLLIALLARCVDGGGRQGAPDGQEAIAGHIHGVGLPTNEVEVSRDGGRTWELRASS